MAAKEKNQKRSEAGGRPTIYTQELASEICSRIAEGESLRSVAKDPKMPSVSTVCRWLLDTERKEFWEQYEKARNAQAELMFDELLDIADDGENDYVLRENKDGSDWWQYNGEAVQRSRLRVDTRKWYLSKVLPKKYGDKLDLTSGGKELPTPIMSLNVSRNDSDTEDKGAE